MVTLIRRLTLGCISLVVLAVGGCGGTGAPSPAPQIATPTPILAAARLATPTPEPTATASPAAPPLPAPTPSPTPWVHPFGRVEDIPSPDGRWTAVLNTEVGSLDLRGPGAERFSIFRPGSTAHNVTWSPDSQHLLVVRTHWLPSQPDVGVLAIAPIQIWQIFVEAINPMNPHCCLNQHRFTHA